MNCEGVLETRIRRMQEADLSAAAEIDVLSFSLPWPASAFRYELFENEHARCWIAELRNAQGWQIAAMAVAWMIVDEIHIGTIAVHPDCRRLGLGRNLMLFILREAAAEGAVRACLEVRRGNISAQALYKSLGFEEIGLRRRYYKDNDEDAVLMDLSKLLERPEYAPGMQLDSQ